MKYLPLIGVLLLGVIAFTMVFPSVPLKFGATGFNSFNSTTASTSAMSIGPDESRQLVPSRNTRYSLSFKTANASTETVNFVSCDSTVAAANNVGIPLLGTTTIELFEDANMTGACTGYASASTTIFVTELLHN